MIEVFDALENLPKILNLRKAIFSMLIALMLGIQVPKDVQAGISLVEYGHVLCIVAYLRDTQDKIVLVIKQASEYRQFFQCINRAAARYLLFKYSH